MSVSGLLWSADPNLGKVETSERLGENLFLCLGESHLIPISHAAKRARDECALKKERGKLEFLEQNASTSIQV